MEKTANNAARKKAIKPGIKMIPLMVAQIFLAGCLSSRAGNFPTDITTPAKKFKEPTGLDYTTEIKAEWITPERPNKNIADVVAGEMGERFEEILKQSGNFSKVAKGENTEPYHAKITKEMITHNTGWVILSTIVSGVGLILPRYAGTTETNITVEIFKKGKSLKVYEYKGAKMHDFGWTLFLFVMPFTRSSKVYGELELFTFKKFLADAEADQIFSK